MKGCFQGLLGTLNSKSPEVMNGYLKQATEYFQYDHIFATSQTAVNNRTKTPASRTKKTGQVL